jgi:calcineurin-like phosphoesterase family protein
MLKLKNINPDKLFFSSDFHGFHVNICEGTTKWDRRPFDTVRDFAGPEEMTLQMVENINKKVPEDGILFHLGDWSFGGADKIEKLRGMLNVRTIYLCRGNHDHHIDKYPHLFKGIYDLLEICVEKQHVVLCHYPMRSWNRSAKPEPSWHLFGHVHSSMAPYGKSFDVGIDSHINFEPFSWREIKQIMLTLPQNEFDS